MTHDDTMPAGTPGLRARSWLGVHAPIQQAAVALLEEARVGPLGELDLGHVLLVTPGGRAGRRCLEALWSAAQADGRSLLPPRTVTPGNLEFALRGPIGRPLANPTEIRLAVIQSLREASEGVRSKLLGRASSGKELHAVADRLVAANRELAMAQRSWEQVAQAAEESGADGSRYLAVQAIIDNARDRLEAVGLLEPERLRTELLDTPPIDGSVVVLLGVVELPSRLRAAMAGIDTWPMIVAEPARGDAFDSWGALNIEAWPAAGPKVSADTIQVEDKPIDVAEAVVERLAEIAGDAPLDPDAVSVVLADESIAPVLDRELRATGCPVHLGPGRTVGGLAPCTELSTLAGYLREPSTDQLLAMFGLGAFVDALGVDAPSDEPSPRAALEAWRRVHHPRTLAEGWIGAADEQGIRRELAIARTVLHRVAPAVDTILAPLQGDSRELGAWMPEILGFLGRLHPVEDEHDPWLDPALECIQSAASELAGVASDFQPVVSAADAIEFLVAVAEREQVRLASPAHAIEVIGWLETPFDPTPEVVVVGFNDGAVPQSSGVDPLLPDRIRKALGLPNEESRTARDAWVLSTLADRRARFLVGRRDGRGEGLVPSRLLLQESGDELARRVLSLFEEQAPRVRAGGGDSKFTRPEPPQGPDAPPPPFKSVRVTAFRDYLKCPYGFWLRHILGLQPPDLLGTEFDARGFGNALHAVVERFAEIPGNDKLVDHEKIEDILHDELDRELEKLAGESPQLGMRLQRRILQRRLSMVAREQARESANGWRVHEVEYFLEKPLEIPGQEPIIVRGVVDRIERHETLGWRIIDFKTSDRGKSPDQAHHAPRSDEQWKDLQLPLYRHLLKEELTAIQDGEIHTGYFIVPSALSQIGIVMSDRIHKAHDEAIARAQQVVRDVRAGRFEPGAKAPSDDHPFAMIQRVCAIADEDSLGGEEDGGGDA